MYSASRQKPGRQKTLECSFDERGVKSSDTARIEGRKTSSSASKHSHGLGVSSARSAVRYPRGARGIRVPRQPRQRECFRIALPGSAAVTGRGKFLSLNGNESIEEKREPAECCIRQECWAGEKRKGITTRRKRPEGGSLKVKRSYECNRKITTTDDFPAHPARMTVLYPIATFFYVVRRLHYSVKEDFQSQVPHESRSGASTCCTVSAGIISDRDLARRREFFRKESSTPYHRGRSRQ